MTITESVVLKMMEPYLDNWRTLYVDSYYNTMNLNMYFLQRNTGFVGTFSKSRTRSDIKIKFPKNKGHEIYLNNPENNLCMVYVKDRKQFIITSNLEFPRSIIKSPRSRFNKEKKKNTLSMIENYIYYSKGVDLCNQVCTNLDLNTLVESGGNLYVSILSK